MDANSIHSGNLLKTTSILSIALFCAKKVSCKHQAMGDVRRRIDDQKHKNVTQSLQNQQKIQGENSP